MKDFAIHVEGDVVYRKGVQEHLGSKLGYQSPTSFAIEESFLVITFDGGAKKGIPLRRIDEITEG